MKNKVDVLGTEYAILYDVDPENMPEGADGCMDQSTHIIKIAKMITDKNSLQNMVEYKKKVLRHEIIHAFFYESGIWNNSGYIDAWGLSEELTDWIAIQFPKMLKAFEEVGCI